MLEKFDGNKYLLTIKVPTLEHAEHSAHSKRRRIEEYSCFTKTGKGFIK